MIHEGVDIRALEKLADETPQLCAIEIMKDGRGLRIDQSLNPSPRGDAADAKEAFAVLYDPVSGALRMEIIESMRQDLAADHFRATAIFEGWKIIFDAWGRPDQIGRLLVAIMQQGGAKWLDKALGGR